MNLQRLENVYKVYKVRKVYKVNNSIDSFTVINKAPAGSMNFINLINFQPDVLRTSSPHRPMKHLDLFIPQLDFVRFLVIIHKVRDNQSDLFR